MINFTDIEPAKIRETPTYIQDYIADYTACAMEHLAKSGYAFCPMFEAFMRSKVAAQLDMPANIYLWKGPSAIYRDFLEECRQKDIVLEKIEKNADEYAYNVCAAHWAGYVSRVWHYYIGMPSLTIIELYNAKQFYYQYYAGHTMDPEGWVQSILGVLDFDREAYPDPFFLDF